MDAHIVNKRVCIQIVIFEYVQYLNGSYITLYIGETVITKNGGRVHNYPFCESS